MESAMKSSNICLIRYLESDYRNNGRGIIQRDSSWEFSMIIKKYESSDSGIPVNPKKGK